MKKFGRFRFSISSLLGFTSVIAAIIAFWQSGESSSSIFKLFFHGLIAFAAWQDLRAYNRVQSSLDSVGFRWFYRIARVFALFAFLFLLINTLIGMRGFPDNPVVERMRFVFGNRSDFLILFSVIAGTLPLSEKYFRERGNRVQNIIGGLGKTLSAVLILFTALDPLFVIFFILVSALGIGWQQRQPVSPYDDPAHVTASIHQLIGNPAIVLDTILTLVGVIGVFIFVVSRKGSVWAKIGFLIAAASAFSALSGLFSFWNDTTFFRSDLSNADIVAISSGGTVLVLFGIGLFAAYLSYAPTTPRGMLTEFVPVEYHPDSVFALVGIAGVIVAEFLPKLFRKTTFGVVGIPGIPMPHQLLVFFWMIVAASGIRLLRNRGGSSIVWWVVGHSIIVIAIVCGVYGIRPPTDWFLDWGLGMGWSPSRMMVWVYFVRATILVAVSFCLAKQLMRRRSEAQFRSESLAGRLFFYFVLTGVALADVVFAECSLGWIVGVRWILPLNGVVYTMLELLSNSFLMNHEMGALLVLWLYGYRSQANNLLHVPERSHAVFWEFSLRRFAALLVMLTIYMPATIVLSWRLFIQLALPII